MTNVKLKIGDKAPLFTAESYNAGTIELKELIGKEKIVLIFSRYFGCPICLLDLKKLIECLPDIENKGAKILYITQSSEEIAKNVIQDEDIHFPIIGSTKIPGTKHDYKIYKEYGLGKMTLGAASKVPSKLRAAKKAGIKHGEFEGYEYQCPGQFVIDIDGKIVHAKKGWLDIKKIIENI
ncbi:MAG: redoxin domain-containing protein [Promethearchaeota archaeon]